MHLEVAYNLRTDSFLMALMRCLRHQESPEVIFGDKRTNFIVAEREVCGKLNSLNTNIVSGNRFRHLDGASRRTSRSSRRINSAVTRMQPMSN